MRIVFIGASRFGLLCLERVLSLDGCQVVGVVTAPQTFSISYRPEGVTNVLYADSHSYCLRNNIDCTIIERGMKNAALFEKVRAWQPDMFLVVGWYHMIPKRWRNLAPAYGLHASLLPDYSGGAPLVWAMINGEEKTGITFFQFNDGVDSGPIIGQSETDILKNDTIATLYSRIEQLGLDLLIKHLPELANDRAILITQDETKRRTFPQRGPEDGLIDWNKSCSDIFNFVRAQTKPYPGAFTFYKGQKLTIWDCDPLTNTQDANNIGEVFAEPSQFIVKCGDGAVMIKCLFDKTIGDIDGLKYRKKYIKGGVILGS